MLIGSFLRTPPLLSPSPPFFLPILLSPALGGTRHRFSGPPPRPGSEGSRLHNLFTCFFSPVLLLFYRTAHKPPPPPSVRPKILPAEVSLPPALPADGADGPCWRPQLKSLQAPRAPDGHSAQPHTGPLFPPGFSRSAATAPQMSACKLRANTVWRMRLFRQVNVYCVFTLHLPVPFVNPFSVQVADDRRLSPFSGGCSCPY